MVKSHETNPKNIIHMILHAYYNVYIYIYHIFHIYIYTYKQINKHYYTFILIFSLLQNVANMISKMLQPSHPSDPHCQTHRSWISGASPLESLCSPGMPPASCASCGRWDHNHKKVENNYIFYTLKCSSYLLFTFFGLPEFINILILSDTLVCVWVCVSFSVCVCMLNVE